VKHAKPACHDPFHLHFSVEMKTEKVGKRARGGDGEISKPNKEYTNFQPSGFHIIKHGTHTGKKES